MKKMCVRCRKIFCDCSKDCGCKEAHTPVTMDLCPECKEKQDEASNL